MRPTTDNERTPAAAPNQITSTNSTANAFLGGNTRSWMTGVYSRPHSPAKQIQVLASSKSNNPPSAILPSPAPSNEPSPVQTNQGFRVTEGEQVAPPPQPPTPSISSQTNTAIQAPAAHTPPPIITVTPEARNFPARPSVPAAKRRKMSAANFPSLRNWLPMIDQYIQSSGGGQQHVERQRFSLIRKACSQDDYFYIALHQIYCLWSHDPEEVTRLTMPGGKRILENSLATVGQLIGGNSSISPPHLKWFSVFPNSLSELMHRSDQYKGAVSDVCTFLTNLSSKWLNFRSTCVRRGYPPLVDELVTEFGLHSPIFQQICFTATRRNLGINDNGYSLAMDRLFTQDQEAHRLISSRVHTDYPPTEREIVERNIWQANQYISLCRAHRSQHTPVVPSNMPQSVQSPNTLPPVTHPGRPNTIRTEVSPSELLSPSPLSLTTRNQYPVSQFTHGPPPPSSQGRPNVSVSEHSASFQSIPVQWPSQAFPGHQNTNLRNVVGPSTHFGQQSNVRHIQDQGNRSAQAYSRSTHSPHQQSSHNPQNSHFPQTTNVASLPMQTIPRRNNSLNNTTPPLAAMPAGQSLNQPQQQPPTIAPLIPPAGFTTAYQFPQPQRSALHQAHLRSPILSPAEVEGHATKGPMAKYYQAVQGFAVEPTILPDRLMVSEFSFTVPKSVFEKIAEDEVSCPSAPPLRKVQQGTLQYRVRCCHIKKGRRDFDGRECVVTDTTWPSTIFMEINGSILEIRRKHHHGKDLPVDITPHVFRHGPDNKNTVKISIPWSLEKQRGISYVVAIEVVEILQHQQILDMCLNNQRITAEETIKCINGKLSSNTNDDDVALVCSDLTIDLADPFTTQIFSIPVRGNHCLHQECFDLETFLTTRNSKSGRPEDPSMVDVWKCPLCGRDARPRSLLVDNFLVSVREKLEREGRLDTRAISVAADGSWSPKLEQTKRRSKSRGRSTSKNEEEDNDDTTMTDQNHGSRPTEIIEVDDD